MESKIENWEEEWNKFICKYFDSLNNHDNKVKEDIKQFIKKTLKSQEDKVPIGVSEWKEYGKKYGYWNFFEDKYKKVLRDIVGDDVHLGESNFEIMFNKGYNKRRKDIISIINKHKIKV